VGVGGETAHMFPLSAISRKGEGDTGFLRQKTEIELPKKGESDRRDREVNRKAELAGKGIGVSVIGHRSVWCTATPPDLIRSGLVLLDGNTEKRGSRERLSSRKQTDRVLTQPSESDGACAA